MKNKNIFRRIFCLALSILICFSMCVTVSANAADTAEITFEDVVGRAGEEVTVPVTIKNNPGIATFRFRVSYDTEALEFISVSKGDLITEGTLSSITDSDAQNVTFLWYNVSDIVGDGELATLTFKIAEDVHGEFSLDVICLAEDLLDEDVQKVPYTVNAGKIITASAVSGEVTSYGVDITGVTLRLLKDGAELDTVTAIDGNYTFKYVLPGTYIIEVSEPQYVTKSYPITMGDEDVIQDFELVLIGDVNSDGSLNARDAAILMQYINGWGVDINIECGDLKHDGKINSKDYVLLMRYINGWDIELN